MQAIASLSNTGPSSYDQEQFFNAVSEALSEWRKNDLYQQRLDANNSSTSIENFDDLKSLPTIDMREFKQHPEDLIINREQVSHEYALYSSGTTSDSQSYTLRSEDGYQHHKSNFKNFVDFLLPQLDRMHALSPTEETVDKLSDSQAKRAVFTYPHWIFEDLDTEFYVDIENGELVPDVEGMIENIKQENKSQGIFSTPNKLYEVAKNLDEKDITLDLGENAIVLTAGGWKGEISSGKDEFRDLIQTVFGISPEAHLDFYGCTELFFATGNKYGDGNPDQKRVAPQGYVWIADEDHFLQTGELVSVDEGEPGLLVAVDPTNTDYPGVLLTDDIVRKVGGEYGEDVRIEYIGRSSMG